MKIEERFAMDLHQGNLFWPTTITIPSFEVLKEDKECDITIIGGGMSGLISAYKLGSLGYKVILIEKNKIATGSSSANTGLLQFSSDIMLFKLAQQIGERDAYLFYKMCFEAMESFRELPKNILEESDYCTRESVFLVSDKNDLTDLKTEYQTLKKHGFPVEFLESYSLKLKYNINAPGAILTLKDAEVNPVKLIVSLANNINTNNVNIYDNTEMFDVLYKGSEILVKTKDAVIASKYLIYTTGYERTIANRIDKSKLNYTYAIATNVLDSLPWKDKSMIWETAIPYLYARMTVDNRIVAGGLDETHKIEMNDTQILIKGEEILAQLKSIMPKLEAKVEYSWKAVFGESTDELPFIGKDPLNNNTYYCLGFGGNGTVYSMAGAKIITDLIRKKVNPYAHIVKIDR